MKSTCLLGPLGLRASLSMLILLDKKALAVPEKDEKDQML